MDFLRLDMMRINDSGGILGRTLMLMWFETFFVVGCYPYGHNTLIFFMSFMDSLLGTERLGAFSKIAQQFSDRARNKRQAS